MGYGESLGVSSCAGYVYGPAYATSELTGARVYDKEDDGAEVARDLPAILYALVPNPLWQEGNQMSVERPDGMPVIWIPIWKSQHRGETYCLPMLLRPGEKHPELTTNDGYAVTPPFGPYLGSAGDVWDQETCGDAGWDWPRLSQECFDQGTYYFKQDCARQGPRSVVVTGTRTWLTAHFTREQWNRVPKRQILRHPRAVPIDTSKGSGPPMKAVPDQPQPTRPVPKEGEAPPPRNYEPVLGTPAPTAVKASAPPGKAAPSGPPPGSQLSAPTARIAETGVAQVDAVPTVPRAPPLQPAKAPPVGGSSSDGPAGEAPAVAKGPPSVLAGSSGTPVVFTGPDNT